MREAHIWRSLRVFDVVPDLKEKCRVDLGIFCLK
jgi:hypothetical protein